MASINMQTQEEKHSVEEKFDAISLFNLAEDVLNQAIIAAEKHFLGQEQAGRTGSSRISDSSYPLRKLKQIVCKVECNTNNIEEVVNSVINLPSDTDSWAEKAVLTLAAFAMVYGQLLFYVDTRELNGFASSMSSLMGVDFLIGHSQDRNFRQAFVDLNKLTNILMEMIEYIFDFEKLLGYNRKDRSLMRLVLRTREVVVEQSERVIRNVIDCIRQVNYLIDGRVPALGLSSNISDLSEQLEDLDKWDQEIDDLKAYMKIVSFRPNPEGITELIKSLMHCREGGQYLYDCHSEQQVKIELLKGKKVLLFISTPNLSDYDLEAVQVVHKELIKEHPDDYKIVWMPIVVDEKQEWDFTMEVKSKEMRKKMEWYAVHYPKPIIGIKYIRKEWHFGKNPMVVVFDSDGGMLCDDAMHMIRLWPMAAFTFRPQREFTLIHPQQEFTLIEGNDLITLLSPHYVKIRDEVNKGSYIVIYGGKDKWIETFRGHVEKLKESAAKKQISVASFTIIQDNNNNNIQDPYGIEAKRFWSIIESLHYLKMQWDLVDDAAIATQKLLSYNREDQEGWALVYQKGSSFLAKPCVSGVAIAEAVEKVVSNGNSKSPKPFGEFIVTCMKEIPPPGTGHCRNIQIPDGSVWVPLEVKCPFCPAKLKKAIAYK